MSKTLVKSLGEFVDSFFYFKMKGVSTVVMNMVKTCKDFTNKQFIIDNLIYTTLVVHLKLLNANDSIT